MDSSQSIASATTEPEPREYRPHPAAELFPMMEQEELRQLAQDIKENGQCESIVIWRGQILDGRNRLAACKLAEVEPEFSEYDEDYPLDPVSYVLSHNLHRRHLNTAQRALVAARLKALEQSKAKERQRQGRANLPHPNEAGRARDKAGEKLNVSGRSVDAASKIIANGAPALVALVESGEVSLNVAAQLAEAPRECQERAAKLGKFGVSREVRRRRGRKRRAEERQQEGRPAEAEEPPDITSFISGARHRIRLLFKDWPPEYVEDIASVLRGLLEEEHATWLERREDKGVQE